MKLSMRLFIRNLHSGKKIWTIEFERGKRRSTGCEVGKEDAEAKRIYNQARKEYLAGKLAFLTGRPSRMLLSDFAAEYLEHGRKMNKSPATLRMDRLALQKFLDHAGAQVRLCDINRRLVEKWVGSLDMKPVSRKTYFRHLKAALSQTVAWDYLKSNPCPSAKQLRLQDDELPPRCLSPQEIKALLAAETDQRYHTLWRFLLATGARRSEALRLTADDIDRDRKLITFRRTKKRRSRTHPLTPEVAAILAEIPVQVGRLWPWQPDSASHHFQKTARKAKLQQVRLHDLRHTYCTNLAAQGLPPWILQILMGHSDLKMTQRYVHLTPADLNKETK